MGNLRVSVAGLEMENPLMVASSPLTAKLELIKEAEEHGFAAVSIKHTMGFQRFEAKPRWFFDGLGLIVSGDPRLSPEYTVDLVRKVKEQTGLKVVCNMSGSPNDIESWGRLSKTFQDAGADGVELNFNCPNLMTADSKIKGAQGANLGSDPESCGKVVADVRAHTKIPVIAKLNTESAKIIPVAHAVSEAGADMLNVHASYRCAPGLDIYHGGRMLYPGSESGNFGGMGGVWSKRASNRFISDVARARTGKPVIGGGGLYTWQDVVEAIMYGTEFVQLCTAVMQHGFGIGKEILKGLSDFMDEQGYETIHEMVGLANQYVCAPGQMKYTDVAANIDQEKCKGCGKCLRIAHCSAIVFEAEDRKCFVDPEHCIGCGLCRGVCSQKAISFATREE